MSDQQAPANADTPAVAGPTEAPGTAQDQPQDTGAGYEQRYKDLQAEYTRGQQELAQLKQEREWAQAALTTSDPDIQRQAFEILGIEVPEGDEFADENFEPDGYEDDPNLQLLQRLEALEGRLSSEDQARQQAAQNEFIYDLAHHQLDELGVPEDDAQVRAFVFNWAQGLPPVQASPGLPVTSLPDIKRAYEEFQAWRDEQINQWAKTKRAPFVPAGGQSANEVPISGTGHNSRMARAMQWVQNNNGDE